MENASNPYIALLPLIFLLLWREESKCPFCFEKNRDRGIPSEKDSGEKFMPIPQEEARSFLIISY